MGQMSTRRDTSKGGSAPGVRPSSLQQRQATPIISQSHMKRGRVVVGEIRNISSFHDSTRARQFLNWSSWVMLHGCLGIKAALQKSQY
jgi:hypothetical protein